MGKRSALTVEPSAGRAPGRAVALLHLLLLFGAGLTIALTWGWDHWSVWQLLVIAAFTFVGGLTYVETTSTKLKVSGAFLGLMLAAVLLGGAPAALIGAASIVVTWFRRREAGHYCATTS